MKLLYLGMLIICINVACTNVERYSIASPDKSKCITIEFHRSLNPRSQPFVRIFPGDSLTKDEYLEVLFDNIGGMDIDWGSSPIKLRTRLIKRNCIPSHKIDVANSMTEDETRLFHMDHSSWRSYDFTWVESGKYDPCTK